MKRTVTNDDVLVACRMQALQVSQAQDRLPITNQVQDERHHSKKANAPRNNANEIDIRLGVDPKQWRHEGEIGCAPRIVIRSA